MAGAHCRWLGADETAYCPLKDEPFSQIQYPAQQIGECTMTDIERLFDALPLIRLSAPNRRRPRLRTWVWDRMPNYNGFTHEERVWNWQVMWWLLDCGVLPFADRCHICGVGKDDGVRIGYHAECYFTLNRMPFLCADCHRKIHQRARRPGIWQELVDRHTRTGTEWFALVSVDHQPDIAQWQRTRFPDVDLSDPFCGALFMLPEGVPPVGLPK